ncbi:hypothetical protein Bca4012_082042 [Brassica carinata]|uniref:RRM domain-containing protein n=1 Tax=Brassica carinata TaxID=52824 RepID=A0A8X8ANK8_BRACI|nr:hypothetical protein Bca52824_028773 [Brassica carinata]
MSCYFRLTATGFDTSLPDVREMVRGVFPQSGCAVLGYGFVFVHLHGQDAIDKALKLSGGFVGGFKIAVKTVLPIKRVSGGVSLARRLAMVEKAKTNQKMIMATEEHF